MNEITQCAVTIWPRAKMSEKGKKECVKKVMRVLKYNEVVWIGTCVSIFLNGGLLYVALWNTGGLIGSPTSSQLSRAQKHNYFRRLIKNNNIICLQEVHGKDEFLQAIQVLAPRFQLFGSFPGNAKCR